MAERQLTIKINALNRTVKELGSYERELERERERLEGFKRSCADGSRVRQQTEVVQETEAMIPDTKGRLARLVEDLERFVGAHADDPTIPEARLAEARAAANGARALL